MNSFLKFFSMQLDFHWENKTLKISLHVSFRHWGKKTNNISLQVSFKNFPEAFKK